MVELLRVKPDGVMNALSTSQVQQYLSLLHPDVRLKELRIPESRDVIRKVRAKAASGDPTVCEEDIAGEIFHIEDAGDRWCRHGSDPFWRME